MQYVELYKDNILDLINLGKTIQDFDETLGDYIKVVIFSEKETKPLAEFYSNRLLFKYENVDSFYIGDYHYHPGDMGFCEGEHHSNTSVSKLKPILTNGDILIQEFNFQTEYKKQFEIFRDDKDRIYVKPNEIIKLLSNDTAGKYKFRIYFLRDIKSILGIFLNINKVNLIENGNFFAGLEATQTGDIDKSNGKNIFIKVGNPGYSPYTLQQNGLPGNIYTMKVTGIQANSTYIFSCWVTWDDKFNGDKAIVSFSNASSLGEKDGIITPLNTDLGGSYLNSPEDRIIETKEINGLVWYRLYSFVQTDDKVDLGSMFVKVGFAGGRFSHSTNPLGSRLFTDLRLVKLNGLTNYDIIEYIKKIKNEIKINNVFKYFNPKIENAGKEYQSSNIEEPMIDETDETSIVAEIFNVERELEDINAEDIIDQMMPAAGGNDGGMRLGGVVSPVIQKDIKNKIRKRRNIKSKLPIKNRPPNKGKKGNLSESKNKKSKGSGGID